MDLIVLSRLVEELDPLLRGLRIDQVYALPRYHLCVVLGTRGAPRLWFSVEPDDPHLCLRSGGHDSPPRPPAFAMAVRKQARGRRITALQTIGGDRVVRLSWGDGAGSLIVELVPRRATGYSLDGESRVVAVWNPRRGRPGVGDLWQPPAPRQRTPASELSDEPQNELRAAHQSGSLPRELMRRVAGVSPISAREIALRAGADEDLVGCIERELRRAREEDTSARIYSPEPLEELTAMPPAETLLLAPYPLLQGSGLLEARFPSLQEAAAAYYALRARLRMVEATRRAVGEAIRARAARIRRTRARIEAASVPRQDPEQLRRLGDLLLAHPHAPIRDDAALVSDVYGDGSPLEIPVHQGLKLPENAERYYRRARRAERRAHHDAGRIATLEREGVALERLRSALAQVRDAAGCAALLDRAERLGLAVKLERAREPEAERPLTPSESPAAAVSLPPPPSRPGIAAYRTDGGAEILVGRSAAANDRLTHEIAAKDDWWLHAEGPGSHVVLRNPGRESEPSAADLATAAALAAWFSKARQSSKVEVHWTRASLVRRPRSGPVGMALLERHSSIRVAPRSPAELGLQEPLTSS